MNFESIAYALLLGVLPALLWLWFWVQEDNLHPEPRSILILTFVAGALTVIATIFIEHFISILFSGDALITTRYVLWAATEEISKLVTVIIIAMGSREMDEPIDAMIYCITAALGFAALENSLYIFTHLSNGDMTAGLISGNVRFMGATLLHVVSSASIGFMIGLAMYKNALIRTISLMVGVILATTLHTSFNLSIIGVKSDTEVLKIFGWVWGAIIILLILFEEIKIVKPKIPEVTEELLEVK